TPRRLPRTHWYNQKRMHSRPPFTNVPDAIEEIRAGRMIVIVDDEDRENEGDLLMAAEKVTPEAINFMAKYGRGLICMPIIEERLEKLNIFDMVNQNTDNHQTAFTVSIDGADTTTGISAQERSSTIKKVIDPNSNKNDFK